MSRNHRSGTGHGRHESLHDESDDETEIRLTPIWLTTQEERDFLIDEINRELRNYEGNYHLDQSFFYHLDARGYPSQGGRGRRVAHGGADRPTPNEMRDLLPRVVARQDLSTYHAVTMFWSFCVVIPVEHPFFSRFGLDEINREPPPPIRISGALVHNIGSGRSDHRHGDHVEHTRSRRSGRRDISADSNGTTASEGIAGRPHGTSRRHDSPADSENSLYRWARGETSDSSHRSGRNHHDRDPRYQSSRYGERYESDSSSDSDSGSDASTLSSPYFRSRYRY
ncbi:hypothetical protein N7G274_009272 [Stereocaulon virgatum]|uniref:Uncharacterized protein n=1 Tax=Stereocaulon virgatum TaxID=373712 RepID=A0ABR3ZWN0_9LECA